MHGLPGTHRASCRSSRPTWTPLIPASSSSFSLQQPSLHPLHQGLCYPLTQGQLQHQHPHHTAIPQQVGLLGPLLLPPLLQEQQAMLLTITQPLLELAIPLLAATPLQPAILLPVVTLLQLAILLQLLLLPLLLNRTLTTLLQALPTLTLELQEEQEEAQRTQWPMEPCLLLNLLPRGPLLQDTMQQLLLLGPAHPQLGQGTLLLLQ